MSKKITIKLRLTPDEAVTLFASVALLSPVEIKEKLKVDRLQDTKEPVHAVVRKIVRGEVYADNYSAYTQVQQQLNDMCKVKYVKETYYIDGIEVGESRRDVPEKVRVDSVNQGDDNV